MLKHSLQAVIDMYCNIDYNPNYLYCLLNELISSEEELIEFCCYFIKYNNYEFINIKSVLENLKLYNESIWEKIKLIELLE